MAFLFTTNCMSPLALNTIKSPSLSSPYRSIEIKQPTFEDDLFSFAPSFDLHTSPSYGVLSSSEYNIFLNPFSPTRHAQDDQFHWPATPEKTPFSYYTTPDGASQDSQDSSIALSPFTSTPDKASQVSQASSIALSPFTCTPTKISQAGSSLATSPLTPLSEVLPARYKRSRPLTTIQDASPCPQQVFKKPRIETRTFPSTVEVDLDQFPLFYRKFHASRYTATVPEENRPPQPGGTYNEPRTGSLDLYSPRFVKGLGASKVGLCPICVEPRARGGENKQVWLSTKFSAFNYHMQYAHGICPSDGLPFSPPLEFRVVASPARTAALKNRKKSNSKKNLFMNVDSMKTHIQQGLCHCCNQWINVEGIKDVETKVKELNWWKHAASCHRGSKIAGETDVFVQDHIFMQLTASNRSSE